MKIADVPGLPPRAKKALPSQELVESLNRFTLAEIERTPGVGAAAIQALIEAGWEPRSGHEAAAEEAEKIFAPGDLVDLDSEMDAAIRRGLSKGCELAHIERLAEEFVGHMCRTATLTPDLVVQAWDAALAFNQESKRAQEVDFELHVGLRVRHLGGDYRVEKVQDVKPADGIPQGSRRVLLVPA